MNKHITDRPQDEETTMQDILQEAWDYLLTDVQRAAEHCTRIEREFSNSVTPNITANICYLMYGVWMQQEVYAMALEQATQGIRCLLQAKESQDLLLTCHLYLAQSRALIQLQRYDEATQAALQAQLLAGKIKDRIALTNTLYTLGRIHSGWEQYDDALVYLLKALRSLSAYRDEKMQGDILDALAQVRMKQLRWIDATDYALRAVQTMESYKRCCTTSEQTPEHGGSVVYDGTEYRRVAFPNNAALSDAYYHLGQCYLHCKEYTLASLQFLYALSLRQALQDNRGIDLCNKALEQCGSYTHLRDWVSYCDDQKLIIRQKARLASSSGYVVRRISVAAEERSQEYALPSLQLHPRAHTLSNKQQVQQKTSTRVSQRQQLRLNKEKKEGTKQSIVNEQDFSAILLQQYPKLTPTEVKICSLLRQNMRSKEIAAIIFVNAKSVDNHRISIRRKMALHRSERLITILLGIGI